MPDFAGSISGTIDREAETYVQTVRVVAVRRFGRLRLVIAEGDISQHRLHPRP
jgi:hypothetical protein